VPVVRYRPAGSLHRVVQGQARPDVRPLDHLLVQRIQERHGFDQVRRELGHEQVAFPQRLVDQLEVKLFQVPQAAVDELARSARGARGQVARLDQGHPQAAGGGVQGGPGPGDAAADDQHVEPLGRQPAEHRAPLAGVQNAVIPHHPFPHRTELLCQNPRHQVRAYLASTGPASLGSLTGPARYSRAA
jgi:hypothetical protein